MGTKRKPTLEDAGKEFHGILVERVARATGNVQRAWGELTSNEKKLYIKCALEVWREVEKCI